MPVGTERNKPSARIYSHGALPNINDLRLKKVRNDSDDSVVLPDLPITIGGPVIKTIVDNFTRGRLSDVAIQIVPINVPTVPTAPIQAAKLFIHSHVLQASIAMSAPIANALRRGAGYGVPLA